MVLIMIGSVSNTIAHKHQRVEPSVSSSSLSTSLIAAVVIPRLNPLDSLPISISSYIFSFLASDDYISIRTVGKPFHRICQLPSSTCSTVIDLISLVQKFPIPRYQANQITSVKLDVTNLLPDIGKKVVVLYPLLLRLQHVHLHGADGLEMVLKRDVGNPRLRSLSLEMEQGDENVCRVTQERDPITGQEILKGLLIPREKIAEYLPRRLDNFRRIQDITDHLKVSFPRISSGTDLPTVILSLPCLKTLNLGSMLIADDSDSLFRDLERCQHLETLSATINHHYLQSVWTKLAGKIQTLTSLTLSMTYPITVTRVIFGKVTTTAFSKVSNEMEKKKSEEIALLPSTSQAPSGAPVSPSFTHLTDLSIVVRDTDLQSFWQEFVVSQLPLTSVKRFSLEIFGANPPRIAPLSLPCTLSMRSLSLRMHVNQISAIWNRGVFEKMHCLDEVSIKPFTNFSLPPAAHSVPKKWSALYPAPLYHSDTIKHFSLTYRYERLDELEAIRDFVLINHRSITRVHLEHTPSSTPIPSKKPPSKMNFSGHPSHLDAWILEARACHSASVVTTVNRSLSSSSTRSTLFAPPHS